MRGEVTGADGRRRSGLPVRVAIWHTCVGCIEVEGRERNFVDNGAVDEQAQCRGLCLVELSVHLGKKCQEAMRGDSSTEGQIKSIGVGAAVDDRVCAIKVKGLIFSCSHREYSRYLFT